MHKNASALPIFFQHWDKTRELSVNKWENKVNCITYFKKEIRYFVVNFKSNALLY